MTTVGGNLGRGGLIVRSQMLELATSTSPGFEDITDKVRAIVAESGVTFGKATVYSRHTTASILIQENEPLLLRDLTRLLRNMAPADAYYEHNDFGRRTVNMRPNEPANGHSHCQSLFLSTSETIPVVDGQIALARFQSVFVIELDRPLLREVVVSVVGC